MGSGYKLATVALPELLESELRGAATAVVQQDGQRQFLFADRAAANRAIDVLRAQQIEVESVQRVTSTLEDVFVRTINAS
jgi:hypothetical protein